VTLVFFRSSRLISTHIQGLGHAVFQYQDHRLELRRQSVEEVKVDGPWITKTGLVAEGLVSQPYIHLDIRTPFGETVGEPQVEATLSESLGARKEKYRIGGWHIQFVEDTNLGSNHRVFVDLVEIGKNAPALSGMDAGISLEVAVEALGELALSEKGEPNFQLLLGGKDFCYSLLYVNGSAFHVLRIAEGVNPHSVARLKRHREYAFSQGKLATTSLKTFIFSDDPLNSYETITNLQPQPISFGLVNQPKSSGSMAISALPLHLGLAHAVKQRDLLTHNRVQIAEQSRNSVIRSRHTFLLAISGTVLACLMVACILGAVIYRGKKEVKILTQNAATYSSQVKIIRGLRISKQSMEEDIKALRPLWNRPIAWSNIFSSLASALPSASGIDGLSVVHKPDGEMELSFRSWVKDWDQVQVIQRKLSAAPSFAAVSLSEQRKDLATGVVIFTVTCTLERI
jgi:Tfp pilus assembly protein PilN